MKNKNIWKTFRNRKRVFHAEIQYMRYHIMITGKQRNSLYVQQQVNDKCRKKYPTHTESEKQISEQHVGLEQEKLLTSVFPNSKSAVIRIKKRLQIFIENNTKKLNYHVRTIYI